MIDVSTEHPSGLPYMELTEKGRKISFRRDCLGTVRIYRKVDEGEEKLLVEKIRTPYTDEENFPAGTHLTYTVLLDQNGKEHQYTLEARL